MLFSGLRRRVVFFLALTPARPRFFVAVFLRPRSAGDSTMFSTDAISSSITSTSASSLCRCVSSAFSRRRISARSSAVLRLARPVLFFLVAFFRVFRVAAFLPAFLRRVVFFFLVGPFPEGSPGPFGSTSTWSSNTLASPTRHLPFDLRRAPPPSLPTTSVTPPRGCGQVVASLWIRPPITWCCRARRAWLATRRPRPACPTRRTT